MSDIRPSADRPPEPLTEHGEPASFGRTYRSRSWLLPSVAVVVALAAVVVLGRAGPTAVPLPTPRPSHVVQPAPSALLRPVVKVPTTVIGQTVGMRRGTARFTDGIPAFIGGDAVYRVREALAVRVGSSILVGGWEMTTDCAEPVDGRCPAIISDVPIAAPRSLALALTGLGPLDPVDGASVVRATVEIDPDCSVRLRDACMPRIAVSETVWSARSDGNMAAAPVDTSALIHDLGVRFPTLDFAPFDEATSCPVWWPLQSYVVTAADVPRANSPALPIRLVVVFPTAQALQLAAPDVRAALARLTPFDASNRCVSVPGGVDDDAWVVSDNAMVLMGPDDRVVRREVTDALHEAVPR